MKRWGWEEERRLRGSEDERERKGKARMAWKG